MTAKRTVSLTLEFMRDVPMHAAIKEALRTELERLDLPVWEVDALVRRFDSGERVIAVPVSRATLARLLRDKTRNDRIVLEKPACND